MPTCCQRVAHQHGSGRPPAFPPASATAGIVHRLSGPPARTRVAASAAALVPSPRARGGLLGPCFNTGPSPRRSCTFAFHPPLRSFRHSLALLSAIGLPPYLAFGALTAVRTALPSSTTRPSVPPGALTRSGRAFQRVARTTAQRRSLPPELFPVQSPLLGESALVSFPVPSDMLKSRT